MIPTLRIISRSSALAKAQTHFVANLFLQQKIHASFVFVESQGDQTQSPLSQSGGKGLFVKGLESKLLQGDADVAVHSYKDMPSIQRPGLCVPALLPRLSSEDVLVSNHYKTLDDLPQGAVLGTASLRRAYLAIEKRPDLCIRLLRGNLQTRLDKLDQEDYDAIILAKAGLERLELSHRIASVLDQSTWLAPAGQGVLAIQAHNKTPYLKEIESLDDLQSRLYARAERAAVLVLGGGCHLPLCVHAFMEGDVLCLSVRALSKHPKQNLRVDISLVLPHYHEAKEGDTHAKERMLLLADDLGKTAANDLLNQGAQALLQASWHFES